MRNSGAKLCFASPKLFATAQGLTIDTLSDVIQVGSDAYQQQLNHMPSLIEPRQADDIAWLFYTSGTTGNPKGACLTHRNLLTMCYCYLTDVDPIAPWSSILHAAPMSHGSGLYALAYVMQAGCHVIPTGGGFDAAETFDLISQWPNIAFFAAPTMVKRLLDHYHTDQPNLCTDNLKAIIYGGGPMYVEDSKAALAAFGPKLTQLYGQGESPMTITALNAQVHANNQHPRWQERLASVGIAQSAVEVQVVDEHGNVLKPSEIGEIIVRGDSVMLGYWQNPEASANVLKNGWLYTGDCGTFDADGFLTLKDRAKDLIISGGSNIYPREVEEVLLRHPAVSEVAVVGIQDREWGEIVVACVVAASGSPTDKAQISNTLDLFCQEHMARFKRPKQYRLLDSLPKNNYGKVLKRELRQQ